MMHHFNWEKEAETQWDHQAQGWNKRSRHMWEHGSRKDTMMPWEFEKLALENGLKYADGFGVYKKGIKVKHYTDLPRELKQSLSFMWLFLLKKAG